MERLTLGQPVALRGFNILGQDAMLHIQPVKGCGWFFNETPITPDILSFANRTVWVEADGAKLGVIEHLGVLRWLGLDGVDLSCDRPLPPVVTPWEVWEHILPYLQQADEFRRVGLEKEIDSFIPGRRGYVQYRPGTQEEMALHVHVRYPHMGERWGVFLISNNTLNKRVLRAGPPATGQLLHFALWMLSWRRGLRQHWQWLNKPWDGRPKDTILSEIVDHRIVDLLGVLAFAASPHLLSGKIFSTCAGHREDVQLIKKIWKEVQNQP